MFLSPRWFGELCADDGRTVGQNPLLPEQKGSIMPLEAAIAPLDDCIAELEGIRGASPSRELSLAITNVKDARNHVIEGLVASGEFTLTRTRELPGPAPEPDPEQPTTPDASAGRPFRPNPEADSLEQPQPGHRTRPTDLVPPEKDHDTEPRKESRTASDGATGQVDQDRSRVTGERVHVEGQEGNQADGGGLDDDAIDELTGDDLDEAVKNAGIDPSKGGSLADGSLSADEKRQALRDA